MLRIDERRFGDVMILDVEGAIDPGPASLVLGGKVERAVNLGYRKVLLNLAALTGANTSAINALLEGLHAARASAAELRLARVDRRLKTLLVLARLHEHFTMFDSEREALASFRSPRSAPGRLPGGQGLVACLQATRLLSADSI